MSMQQQVETVTIEVLGEPRQFKECPRCHLLSEVWEGSKKDCLCTMTEVSFARPV